MASIYFIPLFSKPVIITHSGDYVTRDGNIVHITHVSDQHDYGCHGVYADRVLDYWHKSGRIFTGRETQNDIVAKCE
jgi:hypothetical protein